MTPELWNRLKPLYHAAMEMPGQDRAQFIAEKCRNDRELREELEALIKASDAETKLGNIPIANLRDFFPTERRLLSVGELILGRFKIVRHLGTGGMGDVYEAIDLELGPIALKTIRSEISGNAEVLSRFKKEVQLARKVSGPHICRIHELFIPDLGTQGFHSAFLTMEFLDGITLADKIRLSGPVAWQDAQKIGLEICAGLQTIHEAGIIHRDLKSRNIMLAARNGCTRAVLMDFGVAREFSLLKSEGDTTLPGTIVGTPAYMAPSSSKAER
jgi:serine/threonine protein kinase